MSFLGMGTMEILIILLVAFIFLGPERMVDAARVLGKWTGELRRMGSTVQAEMDELTNVNAPLASTRTQAESSKRVVANDHPLDQEHPVDASDPAGPVAFQRNPEKDVERASTDETRSTRGEESV